MLFSRLSRPTRVRTPQAPATAPAWLDADPPAWDWAHDPDYRSMRVLRIMQNYNISWARFVQTSGGSTAEQVEDAGKYLADVASA